MVERGVRRRMEALTMADNAKYRQLVRRSRDELQCLINEVTVPETWFYRDYQPFVLLQQCVATWRTEHPSDAVLRVLSIPCSSGEEAYSIVMTLLDCGLNSQQFCVDAVDINTKVLQRAQVGVYGRNSFRGEHLDFREHYFRQVSDHYEVLPSLRAAVSFTHGNILNNSFMSARAPYDVIFCRNLLIYFGADNKKKVLEHLGRLLKPAGLLFLGHAETGQFVEELFESVRLTGTFAYRKRAGSGLKPKLLTRPSKQGSLRGVKNSNHLQAQAINNDLEKVKKLAFQAPLVANSLEQKVGDQPRALHFKEDISAIELLANQGDLDRALVLCQRFIDDFPTASEAYYLMGVIKLAQHDETEAVNFFRKAVYLNSNYYQALVQLSMLAEKEGNMRAARNYRMRAQRLEPKGDDA